MESVSILGCGWFGLALGKSLSNEGYKVKGSTTSSQRLNELKDAGLRPYVVNITGSIANYSEEFFNCDVLIVSIPPKMRGGEHEEYLRKIERLVEIINEHKVEQVIFISSTGVYPDVDAEVDEDTAIQPNSDNSRTLLFAENLLLNETGFRATIVRFGGLVGPGRHPGRFFAGKTEIPNGQAPVNLIHLNDCIGITQSILQNRAYGYVFNACSSHHPQKQEFYKIAAEHAHLPIPDFIDELDEWKIVNSKYVPQLLRYEFKINGWTESFNKNLF